MPRSGSRIRNTIHFHVFLSSFFFFFQIGRGHEILDPPHARSVGAQSDAAEAAGQGGEGGDGQAGDTQQVRNTFYSCRRERLIGPDLFFYWFRIKKKKQWYFRERLVDPAFNIGSEFAKPVVYG